MTESAHMLKLTLIFLLRSQIRLWLRQGAIDQERKIFYALFRSSLAESTLLTLPIFPTVVNQPIVQIWA